MQIKSLKTLIFFIAVLLVFLFVMAKWGLPTELNNLFTIKRNQEIHINNETDTELNSLENSLEKLDSTPASLDDITSD